MEDNECIMPPQSKSITHLPLLYNPFLNCIFNNPHHSKNPFRQTVQELSENHNDYTILVPPAHILHELFDPSTEKSSTKIRLHDLCYHNEDFIRSHIIKTNTTYPSIASSKSLLAIYVTMNGKQILIKNGMVFTGKGFKKSLQLKVLDINYFSSFCDYFPKGSKFMILYIEDSLFGSFDPNVPVSMLSKEMGEIKLESASKKGQQFHDITFEKLLRSFPLLSNAVSDKFYKLFHHNNYQFRLLRTNTRKKLSSIKFEFQSMLDEAFKIVLDSVKIDTPDSEQTYHLINYILRLYPGLDLNKLVHEYVELNLYDKLWAQLIFQFDLPDNDKQNNDPDAIKILTQEKYDHLACISLNQLDVPTDKPWHINELHKRIYKAIDEFSKLSDASILNLSGKTQILKNTVNILTNNMNQISGVESMTEKIGSDGLAVNADILIGLLIMVIVHARVDNLEAHLYYIKHFNSVDYTNDGYFCYILSNFDAVIYHLSSSMNDEPQYTGLVQSSELNHKFWSLIDSGDTENLLVLLNEVQQVLGDSKLPNNHFLNSRTVQGESCLMMAVKANNLEAFNYIINHNYQWFSIDDIIFDKNTTTNQSLLTVALTEESYNIITQLVDIIISNTTLEEQILYFNSVDNSGRSVGHYFHHFPDLIDQIGFLIDWELKDLNSHTPLFSLCRCYDHPNYATLLEKGFDCIYKKYDKKSIDFDKHIDKMGNTLLHIILKNLSKTKLLSCGTNLINVNQLNYKNLTPLDLYVKYNRLENLEELLKDDRLDFKFEDSTNFYSVFDFLGSLTAKSPTNKVLKDIEKLIYNYYFTNYYPNTDTEKIAALNARFDTSQKDWVLFFSKSNKIPTLNAEPLDRLRKFIYIFKLDHTYSFFPDNETFWLNFPQEKSMVPIFAKFRINRIIEHVNMYMISLNIHPILTKEKVFENFLVKNKDKLTLELINDITSRQESNKRKYGNLVLGVGQVNEIDFFLRFSLTDLLNFQTTIAKFNKLVAISDIKQSDLRIVTDRMLTSLFSSNILPSNLLRGFNFALTNQYKNQDSSYNELLSFTAWLELSTIELTKNIRRILLKIDDWKELHKNIKELNIELTKYEEDAPTRYATVVPDPTTGAGTADTTHTLPNLANSTNGNLQQAHQLEAEAEEITDTTSSFFSFASIIENKKARYKKLLLMKAEEIKKIMKLNAELKFDHECIAAEISNFLKFKSNFINLGIKRYVRSSLCFLKIRKYELTKLLNSCNR